MDSLLASLITPMPRRPPRDRPAVLLAFLAGSLIAGVFTLIGLAMLGQLRPW